MRTRSLILASHGSTAAPDSNQPLFDLAERVAQLDKSCEHIFDVVKPAFLMGEPEMTNVFDMLGRGHNITGGAAVIVPIMTSQGYYLKKLPGKFNENKSLSNFQVSMAPVIGVHPSMPGRIANHISSLLSQYNLSPSETTVAVIGHGTRRNTTSGQSTFRLTEQLKESFYGSELTFTTGFLDQDPTAELIASQISTPNTLIVPFLVSRGPHTTVDVPEAFRFHGGADLKFPVVHQITESKTLVYAPPLATYPGIDELCLELATEALSSGEILDFEALENGAKQKTTATVSSPTEVRS